MSNLDVQVDKDGNIKLWVKPAYVSLSVQEAWDLGIRLLTAASRAATIQYYRKVQKMRVRQDGAH